MNRVSLRLATLIAALAASSALSLSACHRGTTSGSAGGSSSGERTLHLAIWSNYLSGDFLKAFTARTGIKVETTIYSSNEELLAKLQAGASGYDVAVPSDYMVFTMTKLGLLNELDQTKLTNRKNLDPRFMGKSYDSKNQYSLPFVWGTTGIAVNRRLYSGQVKGYKDLLTNEDLKGKFSLLDDVREAIGAALKSQGLSINTKNPADLEKAKQVLLAARPRVKAFTSETMAPLASGEIAVAQAYMTDALQARRKVGDGKIDFILPEEGGTLWVDNLVIPKGALHLAEAHEFINFMLEPASLVSTATAVYVAPANTAAVSLLPVDFRKDGMLFPVDGQLKRHEMIEDLGEALTLWDRTWTEVKAAQ